MADQPHDAPPRDDRPPLSPLAQLADGLGILDPLDAEPSIVFDPRDEDA